MKDPFVTYVARLHAEKHAVYGDSWKRRGEQVGILANIARKIDRLGVAGAGDTSADTAIDLLVYATMYRLWLTNELHEPPATQQFPRNDGPEAVAFLLRLMPTSTVGFSTTELIRYEKQTFEQLLEIVDAGWPRHRLVDGMIAAANPLARILWEKETCGD